jgi:hypothetical protein
MVINYSVCKYALAACCIIAHHVLLIRYTINFRINHRRKTPLTEFWSWLLSEYRIDHRWGFCHRRSPSWRSSPLTVTKDPNFNCFWLRIDLRRKTPLTDSKLACNWGWVVRYHLIDRITMRDREMPLTSWLLPKIQTSNASG